MRVVLIDDHEVVLHGLRLVLETFPDVEVAAATTNGATISALIREHQPDLVVTDAAMPGFSGLDVLRAALPTPVLILTTFGQAALVSSLIEAGASGYILKGVSPEELVSAMRAATSGGLALDPKVARYAHNELTVLTRAERGVAELVARGHTNREIARELFLAEGTVKNHVSALLRKLRARDRTNLALLLARQLGDLGRGH
ncbi:MULTISPECIES: response regulator transcription factor [unclassified Corynebacterium]|uniref:response regulator transcription factor n=1 Tax=unclassified Corynebacterium TaxID=2624378 RepID=UPI0029CA9D56|nr:MULTISPECIES: response regulator transcription factor [unclassified Corynebacterium]WPF66773.1 response regulator transcription factor [Corynebacterium sp. 22KM0430]WPF69261.1 response regulator transcription factor [Corynebacterium sp. 21KM1197]